MAWAGLAWPGLRWPGWLQYGGDHPLWRHAEYQYAGRAGTGVCPGLSGVGICFLPSCNVPPCEGEFISPAVAAGQRLTRRRRARGADTSPSYYGGEIRQTLRYQYGRAWSRKVRILLIIGSVRDVEQLTPKLTQELWQEDQGTLLLWGGDPGAAVDNAWFTALRKLRYRPADGMVWVTSGFDGVLTTMNRTKPRLTPDEMDSVSHSLKLRYEALGWKLPLYVWSLYEGATKNGRITQPVGCLLPAGCTPQIVAEQFTALASLLIEQGIQQICGQPQHNFYSRWPIS